jgi:hypothetical protein
MYVHYFLKSINEGKGLQNETSIFSKLKDYYYDYSAKPFYYKIDEYNFNLDEIKHGVLRGNKKSPLAYFKTLSWTDARAKLVKGFNDPRINLVCLDFPEIPEHLDSFPDD